MKTFKNMEEISPYYNENTNAYEFIENGERFDVRFEFGFIRAGSITARDISAGSITAENITAENISAWNITAGDITARNITAGDITAWDITAWNITAGDITARDITARDISYFAVCVAYESLKCASIKGRRENARHLCLDGAIAINGKE